MATRSTPRTIYDNTPCPTCGAKPDSACHAVSGNIRPPHKARREEYWRNVWITKACLKGESHGH